MDRYPEHEKLSKVKDDSQRISALLDWLRAEGYEIAMWSKRGDRLYPGRREIEGWLCSCYELDFARLDAEKGMMIETLQPCRRATNC
jgi:hypothetical protein